MIEFPNYDETVDRIRADVAQNLPGVDPTIFGSFVRAFSDALAGRSFDISNLQEQLILQLFPQTATGIFLELWADYQGLSRNPATIARGPVTFLGVSGATIPAFTTFSDGIGNLYISGSKKFNIETQTIGISSLIRVGSLVTAVTTSEHFLGSGQELAVNGAVEAGYDGQHIITVTAPNGFTYLIDTTPTSPATGSIVGSYDGAHRQVNSIETGSDKNKDSGAQLNLVTPIIGVETTGYVQFDGLTDGTDTESDEDLRRRVLNSRANPVANFNVGAITKQAFSVAGVTRVLVKRITPAVGDVTILFVRDNDDSIIPSTGEVANVRDAILEILPATSDENNVYVTAPTPISTDYTFSSISPDTPTMRTAIEENLKAFYQDDVTFETNILEDKYRSAITNTVDPETGEALSLFTLSSPSGDITVTTNEIGVLGSVIF